MLKRPGLLPWITQLFFFFWWHLTVISDKMNGKNGFLHFDSSLLCKLTIVWTVSLKYYHYSGIPQCAKLPKLQTTWSDLFAGITPTNPTLLNQVEELTCRGFKYGTTAKESQIHPFREHQKSWSVLVKSDKAALLQCLCALDLPIIRLKIRAFSRQVSFLCCSGLYPICACSPTFNS